MKLLLCIMFLFVLVLSSCSSHNKTPNAGLLNDRASLPEGFNFSKMGLRVITSTINQKLGTMSTLYGNDAAKITSIAGKAECIPSTLFALITWKQQPDKRWIGGNIPGDLLSLEILKSTTDKKNGAILYNRFKGMNLQADTDTTGENTRVKFILGLKPSIFF